MLGESFRGKKSWLKVLGCKNLLDFFLDNFLRLRVITASYAGVAKVFSCFANRPLFEREKNPDLPLEQNMSNLQSVIFNGKLASWCYKK